MRDYDASIFIKTESGETIPADEFDMPMDYDAVFVIVTNDNLNPEYGDDCTICIHRDWRTLQEDMSVRFAYGDDVSGIYWARTTLQTITLLPGEVVIPDLDYLQYRLEPRQYFEKSFLTRECVNGFRASHQIIANCPLDFELAGITGEKTKRHETDKRAVIPAVMCAYDTVVSFMGKTYHGYLPEIGQLIYINMNITGINNALSKISAGSKERATFDTSTYYSDGKLRLTKRWWSSTLANEHTVVATDDGMILPKDKDYTRGQVLPLYPVDM